ncbi:MAG: hypothetical protein M1470_08870 [Bacteroidetes bacterium]|nr:hypothetical protein [Bacteroidota bacterium]MCL5738029.1 hypothetical protein [Bacteroidota bacterium]
MKRFLLPLTGFFVVPAIHASYTIFENVRLAEHWATETDPNYIALYFSNGEYLIGASYALAAAFSIYALARFVRNRNKGIAGVLGGMTLTGALYVGGCFLLGCCGSPMLAVYLTLFGSTFLGFTKLLTFVLTLASIIVGYIWLERKPVSVKDGTGEIACDCRGDETCKPR